MDSSKKNYIMLNFTIISFLCAVFILILNIFFSINPFSILSYIAAAGFYFLYSVFSSIDNSIKADYLPSGEGAFTLFFLLLASRFFTENIYILFPLTVFTLLILSHLIRKIYYQGAAGVIINPLVLLTTLYLFYYDKNFNLKFLIKLLTGLSEKNYETIILFFIIFIISLIFIYKYRASGIADSHGENYSDSILSGSIFKNIFIILKSIIIVSAIYLSGIAGFASYYIYRFYFKGRINISMIFIFIFFNLLILFSLKFTDPLIVSLAVLFLSAVSHIIYKFKKVDIYGRSIRYKL